MADDVKWQEITDLPADLRPLANDELRPLHRVWTSQRASLSKLPSIEEFNRRLKREWAIETGAIEGVYTVDRGVTEILIQNGINPSLIPHQGSNKTPEHVALIMHDHAEVLEWLFDFVKGSRDLTVGYIKELHAGLLRHQDSITVLMGEELREKELAKGVYKILPNNPRREDGSIYEYCPPEHVASEMDRLIALHTEHLRRGVPPEVESAWLHHRFTQIHPFEDGNGRVARAIASLVFIKAGWFPLVVRQDEKARYIDALEIADAGDLEPLVSLFASLQKRVLLTALDWSYMVKLPESIDAAIDATRDLLIGTGQMVPKEWMRAKEVAAHLLNQSTPRLQHAANRLAAEIGYMRPDFAFSVVAAQRPNETNRIADALRYTPNLADFSLEVELILSTPPRVALIVIAFHTVGTSFRGLIAASAFFFQPEQAPVPICDEFFQINYEEDLDQAQARFGPWLEKSVVRGLTLWQRTLMGNGANEVIS